MYYEKKEQKIPRDVLRWRIAFLQDKLADITAFLESEQNLSVRALREITKLNNVLKHTLKKGKNKKR